MKRKPINIFSKILIFQPALKSKTIRKVVCSNDTTWCITNDGDLYGCGRGYYGQ